MSAEGCGDWAGGLDGCAGGVVAVVVVVFFDDVGVVVDDEEFDPRSEPLGPFWSDCDFGSTDGSVVVVVGGGAGAVLVVVDAAASTKVPAGAPG